MFVSTVLDLVGLVASGSDHVANHFQDLSLVHLLGGIFPRRSFGK